MRLDTRALESADATELFLTATPSEGHSASAEASQMFQSIAEVLRDKQAYILQERVFAPGGHLPAVQSARARAYQGLTESVEPAWLAAADAAGAMPGVQVHALAGASQPQIIQAGGVCGRLVRHGGLSYLTASGISAAEAGQAPAQARAAFQKVEQLLGQVGGDLTNVARTWIFMDDVLSWYGQFNQVRSGFFRERGLLAPAAGGRLPASTGIGVSPADGARCSIDLFAVLGPEDSVRRFEAAGKQRSANEYGSAFARAATAKTPAGKCVFISGTAAIDATGATCFVGDAASQIQMTMENVLAVLGQLSAGPNEVVQAMAYCANPQVQELFLDRWARLHDWPWVTMIADVCRDDLLFEVEALAALA